MPWTICQGLSNRDRSISKFLDGHPNQSRTLITFFVAFTHFIRPIFFHVPLLFILQHLKMKKKPFIIYPWWRCLTWTSNLKFFLLCPEPEKSTTNKKSEAEKKKRKILLRLVFCCQNCSSDREKILKFEAVGWEIAKF